VREIEIVGDTEVTKENWQFQVGYNFHRFLGWLSWYGPTKVLQKLIFHTLLSTSLSLCQSSITTIFTGRSKSAASM